MKGLEKIDDIINKFVAKFDCDAEFGNEFLYWHDDATIQYSLIIGATSDVVWAEYVKNTFDYSIDNIFVFSLLHEIGHHFTMDNFSKKELKQEYKKVENIEENLKESTSIKTDKEYYLQYCDLPMERAATEWAVQYAKKHRKSLENFWKKLQEALTEFYTSNLTE